MLPMLALCGSGAARGPTDADDARIVGPLRPRKGPADAADASFFCAAQAQQGAQLMLMMLALSGRSGPAQGQLLALCGSGAARGPTDADDARLVGPLRPS